MAPIMLIPPKSTTRRTRAVKIAPNAPNCKVDNALQMQPLSFLSPSPVKATTKNVIIRNPTASPKPIHKKSGKIVIVPVTFRTSATIPAIRLTIRPEAVQPILQLQLKKPIISPPITVYAKLLIMLLRMALVCDKIIVILANSILNRVTLQFKSSIISVKRGVILWIK